MEIKTPQLLMGHVMHGRLFPSKNHFRYGIYYLSIPLSKLESLPIPHNRWGVTSFYDRDHEHGSIGTLEEWARSILQKHRLDVDGEIVLICMPRILGYVFNPVSFWLCYNRSEELKAVLCEVHNTFGENHTYLCRHDDGRTILPDETMQAKKMFHVSPFLERDGTYEFRFDCAQDQFKVWIDYFDASGQKKLVTALGGHYESLTQASCRKAFWKYPLVTGRAIILIHYQAIKLVLKRIRYVPKPVQKQPKVSATENLTKM